MLVVGPRLEGEHSGQLLPENNGHSACLSDGCSSQFVSDSAIHLCCPLLPPSYSGVIRRDFVIFPLLKMLRVSMGGVISWDPGSLPSATGARRRAHHEWCSEYLGHVMHGTYDI